MINLCINYADGNQIISRFNGSKGDAVEHYSWNNVMVGENNQEQALVTSIEFLDDLTTYHFKNATKNPA